MSARELSTGTPLDPWDDFRTLTSARIALGRCGASVPTRELLDFGLAHARARDAVTTPFDTASLEAKLQSLGILTRLLHSQVSTRDEYLRRPDLGRRLKNTSRDELKSLRASGPYDLCIIVSDGLSSRSTEHAPTVIAALQPALDSAGWKVSPTLIVPFARVAIQDEIGSALGATLSLILLGERPGLGSPDSLGAYLVFDPKPGKTDADRNCVSNIRPEGLPPNNAAATLLYLLTTAHDLKLSGIKLKDERILSGPAGQTLLP